MADKSVEAGIIHLDTVEGYILWPLPLPDRIAAVDIAAEEPRVFYELNPGDVVVHYNYDEVHDYYHRQK